MEIGTAKKIHHLARYFGILALICLFGYKYTGLAHQFLAFVGPPLFLTYLLRVRAGIFVQWLPNEPFFNDLFLFFPLTFIYFGLVGFQLKNILNERGKLRLVALAAFLLFLIYIHLLSFQEISLYWEGSGKLTR